MSTGTKALLVLAVLVAYPVFFFWSLFVVYDELPEPNAPECGGTVVFGHRAAVPLGAHAPVFAPGSTAAVAWLAEHGICAYDVDCFQTADGALVVGHPAELRQRLGLANPPDALSLADLRTADGGQSATVDEFMAAYAATKCFAQAPRARSPATNLKLLFEPKGAAATAATLDTIATQMMAHRLAAGSVGVWLSSSGPGDGANGHGANALARTARRLGLWPLLAVKGAATGGPPARTPGGHRGPDPDERGGPSAKGPSAPQKKGPLSLARSPFAALGPSVAHPLLSALVPPAARARGQLLFTWVVDDSAQLAVATAAGADGVISNDPIAIQAELCKRHIK